MSALREPHGDLVMCVDRHNTAHVLRPLDDRPVLTPTICGCERFDLGAVYDLLETLSAPWHLLTNPQYRAWPPWPCQTCLRLVEEAAA